MLVPLTPADREAMRSVLSSLGAASAPASIEEIEWHRQAADYDRRLARLRDLIRAHRLSHPDIRVRMA